MQNTLECSQINVLLAALINCASVIIKPSMEIDLKTNLEFPQAILYYKNLSGNFCTDQRRFSLAECKCLYFAWISRMRTTLRAF